MTPALLERPALLGAASAAGGEGAAARRRVTLEERLNAVLHGVRTNGSIECPVCDARMTPAREGAAGAARDGAACASCGSHLS